MPTVNEILAAFQSLNKNMEQVATSQAINNLNEQVQAIRDTNANETKMAEQIRELVSNATLDIMSRGGTPQQAATIFDAVSPGQGFFEQLKARSQARKEGGPIQSRLQAAGVAADPSVSEARRIEGQAALDEARRKDAADRKLKAELARRKLQDAQRKTQNQRETKALGELTKGFDIANADNKARRNLSQNRQILDRIRGIRAIVGGPLTDENLNKVDPTRAAEIAVSLASVLRRGSPTELEFKKLFPGYVAGMKAAELKQIVTNSPQPANIGKFVKLYLKTAGREAALARENAERGVLNNLRSRLRWVEQVPEGERFFRENAAGLLDTTPDQVVFERDKRGRIVNVTTQLTQAQRDLTQDYIRRGRQILSFRRSKDPKKQAIFKDFLGNLGMDADVSLRQLEEELRFRAAFEVMTQGGQ